MSHRRFSPLLVAAVLLAPVGCVDDPVRPDELIPLTEAEAELLGLTAFRQALVEALDATPDGVTTAPPGPFLAPETLSVEDSATVACPLGGSIDVKVSVSATVDEEAGVASLDFALVQTHRQCKQEEQGVTFFLDGAPNVTLAMHLAVEGSGPVTVSGSMTGGMIAGVDYRGGKCTVAIDFTGVSPSDGPATYDFHGTMCGEPVDETLTLPASST